MCALFYRFSCTTGSAGQRTSVNLQRFTWMTEAYATTTYIFSSYPSYDSSM